MVNTTRNTIQRRVHGLRYDPTEETVNDDSGIVGSLVTGDHLVDDAEIGMGTQ